MSAAVVALLAALVLGVGGVAWAAPVNDDRDDAIVLRLGATNTIDNTAATIEDSEALTPNDPAGQRCSNSAGVGTEKGNQMLRTLWWEFVGTGGPVTVSSDESDVGLDTVLGVYDKSSGRLLGCNDDIQPDDPGGTYFTGIRYASEMILPTVAGNRYMIQIGGCGPQPQSKCGSKVSGNIAVRASSPPANDARADATAIVAGVPLTLDNTGATLEPGEVDACGTSRFAKTVWLRWRAPAAGQATFAATGSERELDTVLAVYRGEAATPLACNDDAVDSRGGAGGGSSIPPTQPSGPPVEVQPGDYMIQVAGYRGTPFTEVAAYHGPIIVQVSFLEDTDLDDDGFARGVDCDDRDATVHPGAIEVSNDPVDDDCDGIVALDRDLDGALAPPAGADCDDANAAMHPGATEIRGNGVDEDCDGADAPAPPRPALRRMRPIYTFVHAPAPGARWIHVKNFYVTRVPPGSTIELRCHGRHCVEKRSNRQLVLRTRPRVSLMTALRRSLRRPKKHLVLRVGTVIEIRIRQRGFVGERRTIRIRRDKTALIADSCLTQTGSVRRC